MSGGAEKEAHPFTRLAFADKRIPTAVRWSAPQPDTEITWFDVSLEIAGVVEAGLVLHAEANRFRPEEHVSFEIRLARTPGRGCVPLMRVDWRSTKGGHTVQRKYGSILKGKGLSRLIGRRLSDTHYHAFEMNWDEIKERMIGQNLPIADDISPAPDSFATLKLYVGREFRVANLAIVPEPEWQYDLFRGER